MKYTVIKRIPFSHSNDYVSVVKEAETFEEAMKYKVAAEMLETKDSGHTIEVLINTDNAFDFTRKPLMLTEEVKKVS
jgi:hypothetical protein|tara:strand:- start:63 stop:293 length:231 start_codon:yes stop_codon:yes gene_type:complete